MIDLQVKLSKLYWRSLDTRELELQVNTSEFYMASDSRRAKWVIGAWAIDIPVVKTTSDAGKRV